MDTIRSRIETAIVAALQSVTAIGADGVIEADVEEPAGLVSERAKAGLWTVQVLFGDDDVADGGDRQRQTNVENWVFPVTMVVHLPERAPADPPTPAVTERTLRSDVAKALVPLFVSKGVAWGAEGGNPAYGPEWNGLALRTSAVGGWGQGASVRGTMATVAWFEIEYRHRRGDPTQ